MFNYKKQLQKFVNKINGKKVDTISYILYANLIFFVLFLLVRFISVLYSPVYSYKTPESIYMVMMWIPVFLFVFTLMGKETKKPAHRMKQFIFSITSFFVIVLSYISEELNYYFMKFLYEIESVNDIPFEFVKGNIIIMTFFVPLSIVLPAFLIVAKSILNRDNRKGIISLEIKALLPEVFKNDETMADIKICENYETGEPCIVPEKKLFESMLVAGGTGSGKTATLIDPYVDQLYRKKAFFVEKEKELAFQALQEGVAEITTPASNYYFNKYFDMSFIKPKSDPLSLKRYKEIFKNFIQGERKGGRQIYPDSINLEELKQFEKIDKDTSIVIPMLKYREKFTFIVKQYKNALLSDEFKFEVKDIGELKNYSFENVEINLKLKEHDLSKIANEESISENEDGIIVEFKNLDSNNFIELNIYSECQNEIIYKNLGLTVVSPDGELAKKCINRASAYNVKVHKIDPNMEEIKTGKISRYNPMAGRSPEKVADDISSILMSLEQSDGGESKAYYVNAGVRAVRNIVILLKVAYPRLNNGLQPTLENVLSLLNDHTHVREYVEELERDLELKTRWSSVIEYMKSSFYPPPTDQNGRAIIGSSIGSQYQKTKEAIGGIINQLDNFLGREEIRYILCNQNESENINLADVLYRGHCLAISTRQSDLGAKLGKAFALFFILSIQTEVLSRFSEHENPENPYFLVIDEFPFYINYKTKDFFSFARKYKTGTLVAVQNLAQLQEESKVFRDIVIANTDTKIIMSKSIAEDAKYISELFGTEEKEIHKISTASTSMLSNKPEMRDSYSVDIKEMEKVSKSDIMDLKFKQCYVKYTNHKERQVITKGYTDFVERPQNFKVAEFDFSKFCNMESDISNINLNKSLDTDIKITNTEEINTKETNIKKENLETIETENTDINAENTDKVNIEATNEINEKIEEILTETQTNQHEELVLPEQQEIKIENISSVDGIKITIKRSDEEL